MRICRRTTCSLESRWQKILCSCADFFGSLRRAIHRHNRVSLFFMTRAALFSLAPRIPPHQALHRTTTTSNDNQDKNRIIDEKNNMLSQVASAEDSLQICRYFLSRFVVQSIAIIVCPFFMTRAAFFSLTPRVPSHQALHRTTARINDYQDKNRIIDEKNKSLQYHHHHQRQG